MAKFLKSIFHPSDKKRSSRLEQVGEDERSDFAPPLDGRRKLSISRSGRMKQANKKRHSLSLDLYGENYQIPEKPRPKEYFVGPQQKENEPQKNSEALRRRSADMEISGNDIAKDNLIDPVHVKTPEEEIDIAFAIIDKTL